MPGTSLSIVDIIAAATVGALGAAALGYLAYLLGGALFGSARGGLDSMKFKKALQKIARADELIREGKLELALRELERAFLLYTASSRESLAGIREHNQAVLSRCLVVAEGLGGTFQNLPEVERLFIERTEVQLIAIKTAETFQNISQKRGRQGKEVPSWGRSEYGKKITEINRELARNEDELNRALRTLLQSIRTPQRHDVTYH